MMEEKELRRYSRVVVDGDEQASSRAMLRAVGFSDDDFKRPQIGIASTWAMTTPCNMHINDLAAEAAEGANEAGGKGVIFNTITISDGISMGTPGMRYSLVSREIIADSIEAVTAGEGFDGLVAIGGCDKNMPGCIMAMARLNRPSIFVYGGPSGPAQNGATSFPFSRRLAPSPAARSTMRNSLTLNARQFPGRGLVAACTRRTRWRRLSKRWA